MIESRRELGRTGLHPVLSRQFVDQSDLEKIEVRLLDRAACRASRNASRRPVSLELAGLARVQSRELEHPVVPAQELMVAVYGCPSGRNPLVSRLRNIAKSTKPQPKPEPKTPTKKP